MAGKKLTTEPDEAMTTQVTEPDEAMTTQAAEPDETMEAQTTEPVKAAGAEETEMVTVKLFKDNINYKDDVFVAVNGERWQIKRGVEVEVPWYVKEVLDHSEREDQRTAQKIEEAQQRAEGR